MAEWGNGNNVSANVDMDSHGYRLRVNGAASGANYQVEIENTGQDLSALKVEGKTLLQNENGTSHALFVNGRTSLGSPAGGRTVGLRVTAQNAIIVSSGLVGLSL